jgi:hypothetical protein
MVVIDLLKHGNEITNPVELSYTTKLLKIIFKIGIVMYSLIKKSVTFVLLLSIFISITEADDTEIYFSSEVSRVNPNVLFVLDVSGSMDELVVGSGGTEIKQFTLIRKIDSARDDAEERLTGSNNQRKAKWGSTDLELSLDGNKRQIVGLRFKNIKIPKEATITNAYIQFQVDETTSCDGKDVMVYTEQADNAPKFKNKSKNINNRAKYGPVTWQPLSWNTVGERGLNQKTPDLKVIVQNVVNRGAWHSGNAIVFMLKGESENNSDHGRCTAESYNGDTDAAPELTIEYEGLAPEKNRLEVMQSALKTVLDNAPTNLNVGLMNYGEIEDSDERLGVKFPVKNIEEVAFPIVNESLPIDELNNREWWRSNIPEPTETVVVRTYLSQITDWFWKDNWYEEKYDNTPVREMDHIGTTPIVEALYEAALYFRGEQLGWGQGESGFWESGRAPSHPASYEGNTIAWDNAICNDTWTKSKWGGESEANSHIDFANNQYDWMNCPSNPSNPSGVGNYAHCAGTEVCNTYQSCPSGHWVSGTSGHCNSYSDPDESGNTYCTNYTSGTSGHCDTANVTKYRCKYKVCDGDFTSYPNYTSPILQSCQRNFIVLLSDGKPQYSNNWDDNGNRDGTNSKGPTYWKLADNDWSGLEDKTDASKKFDHTSCSSNLEPFGYASGACGSELTQFLSNSDQSPLEGLQAVDTYAIGFGLGAEPNASSYLQSLVTTTDGYFEADDEDKLATAFGNILSLVGATTSAYASPGYTVNMKNTTENDEFIYIPVFDKRLAPTWSGNLKKFKLVSSTDEQGRGLRKIQGKNDLDAVSDLGAFSESAIDYWSTSSNDNPDGYYVEKGGVASLLTDPSARKLYSDLECTSMPCYLSSSINHLKEGNANNNKPITNTVLAIDSDKNVVYRQKLIKFIRGYNDDDTARKHMGDILHAAPVILTYKKGAADGVGKEQYVFTATNEGYLHVFDTKTGTEKFAFMPKKLLKNIETQYMNNETGGHRYGIDGQLSLWHDDLDHNDEVNGAEKVYLYLGLRRGGRGYYALDVTDINSPRLLWKIDGETDSDFSNLGYTWSKAYLAGIRREVDDPENTGQTIKQVQKVMIFSGGYDNNQDDEAKITENIDATYGNDIFIIDAKTGSRLWSLQSSNVEGAGDLNHSIPGGMRILDLNRNGAIDRIYFADTGGNIWRLDLNEELNETDSSSSKLIKLASFGGTGENARKFYNEPDVSMFKHKGKSVLAISIGSGYRSHPMSKELKDHFFTVLDPSTFKPIDTDTFTTIQLTADDMAKVSLIVNEEGGKSLNYGALTDDNLLTSSKRGWYLDFASSGEKVLADAITVDGVISFTTFVPQAKPSSVSVVVDLCTAPATQGRLYSMNLLTGKPAYDLDWSGGNPDVNDVFIAVSADEIPGAPQRVFNSFECSGGQCEHTVDIRVGKKLLQASSYDRGYLEPVYWTDPSKAQN